PPKNSAVAISTPESELVGCPEPAAVVLVTISLRIVFALALSCARSGAVVVAATVKSLHKNVNGVRIGSEGRASPQTWISEKRQKATGKAAKIARGNREKVERTGPRCAVICSWARSRLLPPHTTAAPAMPACLPRDGRCGCYGWPSSIRPGPDR